MIHLGGLADVKVLSQLPGRHLPAAYGGGIDNAGTLTVINCTLSDNSATGAQGFGGGIYSYGCVAHRQHSVRKLFRQRGRHPQRRGTLMITDRPACRCLCNA
jgi:hypothetical protein